MEARDWNTNPVWIYNYPYWQLAAEGEMDVWAIRAGIFFVAGVMALLIPNKVLRFQMWALRKLHIKYDIEKEYKYLPYVGVSFIIIAGLLLAYSLR